MHCFRAQNYKQWYLLAYHFVKYSYHFVKYKVYETNFPPYNIITSPPYILSMQSMWKGDKPAGMP